MFVPLPVYLSYLLLTLTIEAPLVLLLLVRRCGWLRSSCVAVLASCITHPLLWFAWTRVIAPAERYGLYVATGETLVVGIEAGVFWGLALRGRATMREGVRIAFGTSLLVNFVSWGTGALLQRWALLEPYVERTSAWLAALLGDP